MFSFIYRTILKPLLFLFDPEFIHDTFLEIGKLLGTNAVTKYITNDFLCYKNPKLSQNIYGIEFENPVGLAAGFDKNGDLMNILENVGFGFMSVGSITQNPYEGNPKPRLYRLPESKSIIVNYGLKNIGAKEIIKKLKKYHTESNSNLKIVMSVAKTNCVETADEEQGIRDYVATLKALRDAEVGHMYEINISCPNAYGGEPFTTPDKLDRLFTEITTLKLGKPVFVKMPINLPWEEFKRLLEVLMRYRVDGVIIGNLTKVRDPKLIKDSFPAGIKGNLSGLPTKELSNNLIRETYKYCGRKMKIIGVGGIFSAEDAYEKIKLGASMVQLITGMVFEGPTLIGEINRGLVQLLKRDGFTRISEAIGKNAN